jgi:predicted DNA-binding protein with PD1-like motif
MLKNLFSITTLVLSASIFTAQAETAENTTSAVVNLGSCSKMANTTQPFILVLNSGDDLLESISQCAKAAKLQGASISGLGQVHNPTLAYFTSNPNDKPKLTTFPGYYELASLNGNISVNGNNYYTHAHASLADKQFHGITGHVNKAKVGLTVEITMIPFSASVQRTVDAKTGFGPLVTG